MLELFFSQPLAFLILFPGLLASITIHEFAHAWMADRLGDPTPRLQDRVTLDPRAHLDPLGVAAMLFTGFGWGRPVEYDPFNLRHPVSDTAKIALAGPASNLVIALVLSLLYHSLGSSLIATFIAAALPLLIFLNISLAIFNLVPVYPLDGSKVLFAALPKPLNYHYDDFMHRNGLVVLIALLLPIVGGRSVISLITSPFIMIVTSILI